MTLASAAGSAPLLCGPGKPASDPRSHSSTEGGEDARQTKERITPYILTTHR